MAAINKRTCDACGLTFLQPFAAGWSWTTNIPTWKGRCPDCTAHTRVKRLDALAGSPRETEA